MDIIICLVTCPSREVAQPLAKTLIDSQVAACVNILPGVQSVYRWKGEVCFDEEVLLVIKSTRAAQEQLQRTVLANHPYETPEFVVLSASDVSEAYGKWVIDSTTM
jgi:periplasmic divalent cation tolerance protein